MLVTDGREETLKLFERLSFGEPDVGPRLVRSSTMRRRSLGLRASRSMLCTTKVSFSLTKVRSRSEAAHGGQVVFPRRPGRRRTHRVGSAA